MSACTFGNKTASTASVEASADPVITETPKASSAPSESASTPYAAETGTAATKTYTVSARKNNAAVDPFAEEKNACSATWGTWVDGTGCTWPSYDDSVADELRILRRNVEKANRALPAAG